MIKEEKSITCKICHDGYESAPKLLLGFYIFTSKQNVNMNHFSGLQNENFGDLTRLIGSVTHFNHIHLKCHTSAAKAERRLKKPKSEWEGATIRNSFTMCNNWFPISGPLTTPQKYQKGLDKYFQSL